MYNRDINCLLNQLRERYLKPLASENVGILEGIWARNTEHVGINPAFNRTVEFANDQDETAVNKVRESTKTAKSYRIDRNLGGKLAMRSSA
jgi:hypothetical protein